MRFQPSDNVGLVVVVAIAVVVVVVIIVNLFRRRKGD